MVKEPLIIINFKKTTGSKAQLIARQLHAAKALLKDRCTIAIAIQPCDVYELSKTTDIPVFVHDLYLPYPIHQELNKSFIRDNNIYGVLMNHPENILTNDVLKANYQIAKELHLKTIIGATSINEALVLSKDYVADYIAIENYDLIGKDISIKNRYPHLVADAVSCIPGKVLFGAGVRSSHDIKYVIENGGTGVLLSSLIMGAIDPVKILTDLLEVSIAGV